MFTKNLMLGVSMMAALAAMPVFANQTADQLALEKEGVALIRDVEEVARDVRYNTAQLNAFAKGTQTTRYAHLLHLEEIKRLVNKGLKPALDRLAEIQPQLPEWKQQSIGRMLESARALAADTNDAILSKNERTTLPPVMNAQYKALLATMYDHASALLKTADVAADYASARLKAHEAGLALASK